jgi:hypothetical protein
MEYVFILFMWLVFSFVVAAVASSRSRNPITWWFISILISPLMSFLFLAMLPNHRRNYEEARRHYETLSALAAANPGSDIKLPAPPQLPKPSHVLSWILWLLVLLAIVVAIAHHAKADGLSGKARDEFVETASAKCAEEFHNNLANPEKYAYQAYCSCLWRGIFHEESPTIALSAPKTYPPECVPSVVG